MLYVAPLWISDNVIHTFNTRGSINDYVCFIPGMRQTIVQRWFHRPTQTWRDVQR